MELSNKMPKNTLLITLILLTVENNAYFLQLHKTTDSSGLTPDNTTSAPFIAYLHQDGQRICEGAIIHKRFIATTLPCCHRMHEESVRIRVGSLNDQKGDEYGVCYYVHDSHYNPTTKTNDICLIKLDKDLIFCDQVNLARLPVKPLVDHEKGTIFTWGEINELHDLQEVDGYYVDKKLCNAQPSPYQICLSDDRGLRTPCGAEIGSPFIIDEMLYGLASAYINCDQYDFDSFIYTDIFAYKKFIEEVIGNSTHDVAC